MPPAHPATGRRVITIIAGEHHVSADPDRAIATLLGCCVAACIRDAAGGVGGMNHFMLPQSGHGRWDRASASLRYGNFAMERLVNDILARGGRRGRLEAKVFGGARLLNDVTGIGARNARFVRDYLAAERIPLLAADLLGEQGRRLVYLPVAGAAFVAPLGRAAARVAAAEDRHGRTIPRQPGGSIELFAGP